MVFMFLMLMVSACKKPKTEIPPGIISPDSMVLVMTDVHIAEAAVVQKNLNGDTGTVYAASFYRFIFEKHHITETVYRNSVAFYNAHPDEYDKIYSQVLTEISKRQADNMQKQNQ